MTDRAAEAARDGLLLVDKPRGPTSHAVIAAIRRCLGGPKTGHTGTLDPLASGLLVVLLGRATRIGRFLPEGSKLYEGRIRFGASTTTDDSQGEVTTRFEGVLPDLEEIRCAAALFEGDRDQVPPRFSAKKVGGKRAYRAARAGAEPVLAPCPVRIEEFRILALEAPGEAAFLARVSPGTYIRSLARDLGSRLGCGAHLVSLRRLESGPFRVAEAVAASAQAPELAARVVPLERIPVAVPTVEVSGSDALRLMAGRTVPVPGGLGGLRLQPDAPFPGWVRILTESGGLVGFGRLQEDPGPAIHGGVILMKPEPDQGGPDSRGNAPIHVI